MRIARGIGLAMTLALGTAAMGGAVEAAYPDHALRLIVPYLPGGSSDVVCRILAQHLEKELGQTVAIVNVDGGGGAVGWQQVMMARPDGYTITMYTDGMPVMEVTGAVSFTHKDFAPVAMWGTMDLTVFAKAGGELKGLADLKAAAEKRPGEVTLAMGYGTPSQFVAQIVEDAIGADLNLVNVGSGAKKKAAVLGGHVDAGIEPVPGLTSDIKSGQFTVLAVLGTEPPIGLPEIRTAKDQGFDAVAYNTYGVIAPKGTPADRVARLSAALAEVAKDPAFIEANEKVSFRVHYEDTAATAAAMDAISARMTEVGKKLGF